MSEPCPADAAAARRPAREALAARITALIDALSDGGRDDARRDALLADLAGFQAAHVPAYRNLVRARTAGDDRAPPPALPTDMFRFAAVTSDPTRTPERVFVSSGTTARERSRHAFFELSLYDHAARTAARYALFPDVPRMPLVVLAPSERQAPHSSLSYMLSRFEGWFGQGPSCTVWRDDALDLRALRERLEAAERSGEPLALLGTSFAFVHALDGLGEEVRFRLPARSRLMFTGGFKGRSREVPPDALRAALCARLGLTDPWLVGEYGMTELSSQLYDHTLREVALGLPLRERALWAPGWLRITLVDGDGLREVPAGEPGLVRVDDAANLDSVSAIQTADVGHRVGDGWRILGRAPGAGARGCSLSVDQALEGGANP